PPDPRSPQECSALGDMPGSFVPTVTAITTSQDLQWLVQPTLISSWHFRDMGRVWGGRSVRDIAGGGTLGTPRGAAPPPSSPIPRTVVGRAAGLGDSGDSGDRPVRVQLTPEEEEKRRVRRERNKLAAAKCRNRRRELTDRLQAETDQLEEEKAELESEIAELRKEKERLEFVLVAHAPACKVPFEDIGPVGAGPAEVSSPGKAGTVAFLPPAPFQGPPGPFPGCCLPPGVPAGPPNATPAFVFTHPEGATCGASHQRSSSSDQSSDSLNSPSLLAL
ncbi:FOS protein, partial [Climacteris rufus]|nr:FOS protein [Climacteris rufus]